MAEQLDKAVVRLCSEIESSLTLNHRAPEVTEYRRGYQEALTSLKNSAPMSDILDALRALGWQPPRVYWVNPPAPVSPDE